MALEENNPPNAKMAAMENDASRMETILSELLVAHFRNGYDCCYPVATTGNKRLEMPPRGEVITASWVKS